MLLLLSLLPICAISSGLHVFTVTPSLCPVGAKCHITVRGAGFMTVPEDLASSTIFTGKATDELFEGFTFQELWDKNIVATQGDFNISSLPPPGVWVLLDPLVERPTLLTPTVKNDRELSFDLDLTTNLTNHTLLKLSLQLFPIVPKGFHAFTVIQLYHHPHITKVEPLILRLSGDQLLSLYSPDFFYSNSIKLRLNSITRQDRQKIIDCYMDVRDNNKTSAVFCQTPAWPEEDNVTLALSFNDQLYIPVGSRELGAKAVKQWRHEAGLNADVDSITIQYADEESLFGNVAKLAIEREVNQTAVDEKDNFKEQQPPTEVDEIFDKEGNLFVLANPVELQRLKNDSRLFLDIAVLTIAVAIGGQIARFLTLPSVVGHLLAGTIVGPSILNLIHHPMQLLSLAQLGSATVMFDVGMHSAVGQIAGVRRGATAGALGGLIILLCIALFIAAIKHTAYIEAMIVAAFLNVSSTALCSREFAEGGHQDVEQLAVGVLLTQDVLFSLILAIVPVLSEFTREGEAVIPLLYTASKLLAGLLLVLLLAYVCIRGTEYFLSSSYLKKSEGEPGGVLTAFTILLVIGVTSEWLMLSMELGAFIAGASFLWIPATIRNDLRKDMMQLQKLFGGLFFSSVGLALDPYFILDNFGRVVSLVASFTLIKVGALYICFRLAGYGSQKAIRTASLLAHIGEFSLVLLRKAVSLQLIQRKVDLVLVASCGLSVMLTPVTLRFLRYITTTVEDEGIYCELHKVSTS